VADRAGPGAYLNVDDERLEFWLGAPEGPIGLRVFALRGVIAASLSPLR
jgi:hypothetical protein